jgi:general secretion pathway protein D
VEEDMQVDPHGRCSRGWSARRLGLTAALLALTLFAPLAQPRAHAQGNSQDDVEYGFVIDPTVPVDADKWLKDWSKQLKTTILADPQMSGVKIKFLVSDVKLTWGVFKKVLDFYDVVLEEKQVGEHWIMFAHLRRNLPTKAGPPFPVVDEKTLPPREQIVTAVLQVQNGAGNDIFATVRGLLVRDVNRIGNILYVRGPEVIIIVDFSSNVEYYLKIIRALDVTAPGQTTQVYRIEFAPAEDISRVLQTLVRPAGGGGQGGQPGVPIGVTGGATLIPPQIIPDPRTNKLIVQAYKHQHDEIKKMISELDVRAPNRPPTFHVYKCKNVDADYLAGKLSELFGTGGGGGSSRKGGSSSAGGAGGAAAPPRASPAPGGFGNVNQAGAGNGQQKADFSAIQTRIVSDELSNSLLISAEEPIYRNILLLLEGNAELPGLDKARRRVLIEAQIWEIATPTDNLTIGFELAAVDNPAAGSFRPSALTSFGLSTVAIDPTTQTLGRIPNFSNGLVGVLTKDTFDKLPVIVQAIANLENSRLVTTPFALTNDNTETVFEITNKIPYQTANLAGSGISQGTVQTIDVKTALTVTPQVNSLENLTLTIDVVLSSIGAAGSPNLPPATNERHYKGEVTVPNMKYVVFGGLESESWGEVEQKVPWLGDIPILGHLFKLKQWTHTKNKLYIFVRPTIFLDDRGLVRVSEDLRDKVHVAAERDEWLPPIASERMVLAPWKTVQDDAFEVFGAGSGNPFGGGKDE